MRHRLSLKAHMREGAAVHVASAGCDLCLPLNTDVATERRGHKMQSHIAWGQSLIAVGIIVVVFGMAGIIFVKKR